jgi:hypothetical protein
MGCAGGVDWFGGTDSVFLHYRIYKVNGDAVIIEAEFEDAIGEGRVEACAEHPADFGCQQRFH